MCRHLTTQTVHQHQAVPRHTRPHTHRQYRGLAGETPLELVREWGADTLEFLLGLYHSPDAAVAGVQQITAYSVFRVC